MTRLFLTLLTACFFFAAKGQSFAQTETQYSDSSEAVRLNAYLKQAKTSFLSNRPLAKQFADKSLSIANSKDEYALELADTYNLSGLIAMYDEKYEEAAKLLEKSVTLSTLHNLPAIKIKALGNLALNYLRKGEYQKSLQANFSLLPLLQGDKTKQNRALVLANMANSYYYLNRLDESINYQLEALKLFEELGYQPGISTAYNTLGANYTSQKQYANAARYLQKSAALKSTLKDYEG
jgi:tetratricopeptide (TPR) repeat protein